MTAKELAHLQAIILFVIAGLDPAIHLF